jgi:hypothetical protein
MFNLNLSSATLKQAEILVSQSALRMFVGPRRSGKTWVAAAQTLSRISDGLPVWYLPSGFNMVQQMKWQLSQLASSTTDWINQFRFVGVQNARDICDLIRTAPPGLLIFDETQRMDPSVISDFLRPQLRSPGWGLLPTIASLETKCLILWNPEELSETGNLLQELSRSTGVVTVVASEPVYPSRTWYINPDGSVTVDNRPGPTDPVYPTSGNFTVYPQYCYCVECKRPQPAPAWWTSGANFVCPECEQKRWNPWQNGAYNRPMPVPQYNANCFKCGVMLNVPVGTDPAVVYMCVVCATKAEPQQKAQPSAPGPVIGGKRAMKLEE